VEDDIPTGPYEWVFNTEAHPLKVKPRASTLVTQKGAEGGGQGMAVQSR